MPRAASHHNSFWTSRRLALCALLCAVALFLSFVEIPLFPPAPFLKYDASGCVALLAAFAFDPATACVVAVLPWCVHFFIEPIGAFIALLTNLALTGSAAWVYKVQQPRKVRGASNAHDTHGTQREHGARSGCNMHGEHGAHNMHDTHGTQCECDAHGTCGGRNMHGTHGARSGRARMVVALFAAAVVQVVVALLLNLFLTPLYAGLPLEAVLAMVLPILLPFNLCKAALNSALTFFAYKPFERAVGGWHGA